MAIANAPFYFQAVSDFGLFCSLGSADQIEFSCITYQCVEGFDFCKPSYNWLISRGIPGSAAMHCITLDHGRPIRGCQALKGGWIVIYHNEKDFIAFPYIENRKKERIAHFYDLTWLSRLPGITKHGDGYNVEFINSNNEIALPRGSCLIPGSPNPSHFVEHYVKHEILGTCTDLEEYIPMTIELTNWQRSMVKGFGSTYLAKLISIDKRILQFPGAYHLRYDDAFIFEDIPQWLGLQHARRIIRQMSIVDDEEPLMGIAYLCRARSELLNRRSSLRVKDFSDVCKLITHAGGTIIYPEMHTPASVQKIISSFSIIIADPGSCNIHALWSPMVGANGSKSFYQLTPAGPFYSDNHDTARGFEWFCNLMGSRFSFLHGLPTGHHEYSGSVETAYYKEAIHGLIRSFT